MHLRKLTGFLYFTKIYPVFLVIFSFFKIVHFSIYSLFGKLSASRNYNFSTVSIWNTNGLKGQASEFKDFIASNNLDIMLVLEAHFQGNYVWVANYVLFNVDRPPTIYTFPSGGTAAYVKMVSMQPSLKYLNCNVLRSFPLF